MNLNRFLRVMAVVIILTPGVAGYSIKWSQPPQFNPASPHPECFWGWDEISIFGGPQIVADDWLCTTDEPVIGIRWWGSYLYWDLPFPPGIVPDMFHIGIWTDMPAGGTEPFSHPDLMIWEAIVPYFDTNEMYVGCDFYPLYTLDSCFEYTVFLNPPDWFYQTPGPTVYWVSICAMYSAPPPGNEWGWKTREHFWNDDAVRIFDPLVPIPGGFYVFGEPIEEPAGVSWDMAFELFTEDAATATPTETPIPTDTPVSTSTPSPSATPTADPNLKWSQPPQYFPGSPYPECYWGWDEPSFYDMFQIVADDWLCDDDRPVAQIRWWGSYWNWDLPFPPNEAPLGFHIGIWTDVPAGGSEPFSHPGMMIWEWFVDRLSIPEIFVGCDYYPGFSYDSCFLYDFIIPAPEWFYQSPGPTVYWISISALYAVPPSANEWGWKTREHYFNDAAVRIFDPMMPGIGAMYNAGEAIELPAGVPWDMAFELIAANVTPTPVPTDTP
nr:hypothetical protein [bacterium]